MGYEAKFTKIIVAAGFVFGAIQAQAAHVAEKELSLPLLFQHSPARIGRGISAASPSHRQPSISFSKTIELNSGGEARLGRSCFIRNTSHENDMGRGSYYGSPLTQAPGGRITQGSNFEMHLISYEEEFVQLELESKLGTKSPSHKFELSCAHAAIQRWSVADLEAQSGNLFAVRVPASITEQGFAGKPLSSGARVMELKGSRYNGIFGSGLPGTSGIQLLFGANLKAYAQETSAPIMVGRRCKILSQSEDALNDRYLKGSKFSFLGFIPRPEKKSVELAFANWNHSPHQIRIECKGSESEVGTLSLNEIERDLNGALRFYRK
jgi:hypothetical protein